MSQASNISQLAAECCIAQQKSWASGERRSVEDFLRDFPQLEEDRDSALDLIYNEVLLGEEFNDPVSTEALLTRFPQWESEIHRMMEVHREIESQPRKTGSTAAENRKGDTPAEGGSRPTYRAEEWIGGYQILGELGRGGMGIVYKAVQPGTQRLVALKVVLTGRFASTTEVARFQAEAEAAARLEHPGVVPVYEIGQHADLHFLSMGLVEGRTLTEFLKTRTLAPKAAAELVLELANTVGYAHSQGIVHRDLKPSNILVEDPSQKRGSDVTSAVDTKPRPARGFGTRITDFGLAKFENQLQSLTLTGQVVGTPQYMSPEQAGGDQDRVAETSDIYALGVILYEAITGHPPFEGATPIDILSLVINQEPLSPRARNRRLDVNLETICLKCLEKNPSRRYQSAEELAADLECYLTGRPIAARPVSKLTCAWRICQRHPLVTSMATTILLLLITLSVGASIALFRLGHEQALTEAGLERATEAERLSKERLYESYLSQARFAVQSRRPGQRNDSLRAIAEAAKLAKELGMSREARITLRSEAIAALRLYDIQPRATIDRKIGSASTAFDPQSVSFDARLRHFAAVLEDGTIGILDCDSGELLHTIPQPKDEFSIQLGPHAERLAVRVGGKLMLWNVSHRSRDPSSSFDAIVAFDFFRDGRLIVYQRNGKLLTETRDKRRKTKVLCETSVKGLHGIKTHPSKPQLAAWKKNHVFLVDLPSGTMSGVLKHHEGCQIQTVDWSPDGRLLAVGSSDHVAYIWDTNSAETPRYELKGHHAWVKRVSFSDRLLLTSSRFDANARIWNPYTGELLMAFDGYGQQLSEDGDRLASIGRGGITVWDVQQNDVLRHFEGNDLHYTTVDARLSRDEKWLVTSDWTGLRLWDFKTGAELDYILVGEVTSLAFAPDSKSVAVATEKGIHRWPLVFNKQKANDRPKFGKATTIAKGDGHLCAQQLQFDRDGDHLLAVEHNYGCKLYDLRSQQAPRFIGSKSLASSSLSGDANYMAMSSDEGGIHIVGLRGEKKRVLFEQCGDTFSRFSPDGRWFAAADRNQYRILDAKSWKLAFEWKTAEPPGPIRHVSFSLDGQRLAILHNRGMIHLLDSSRGSEFAQIPVDRFESWLCLNRDGSQLACIDQRTAVQVWNLERINQHLLPLQLNW